MRSVFKPNSRHMRLIDAPALVLALLQPPACLVTHGLHLKQVPAGATDEVSPCKEHAISAKSCDGRMSCAGPLHAFGARPAGHLPPGPSCKLQSQPLYGTLQTLWCCPLVSSQGIRAYEPLMQLTQRRETPAGHAAQPQRVLQRCSKASSDISSLGLQSSIFDTCWEIKLMAASLAWQSINCCL